MAKQVQLRRGTTAELSSVTGAAGEVIVDTTKDTLTVHDAYTAGGTPLLREDLDNLADQSIAINKIVKGTANQVLKTNGTATGLTWGSPLVDSADLVTYSGAILQTVQAAYGTRVGLSNTTGRQPMWNAVSFTKLRANSKLRVFILMPLGGTGASYPHFAEAYVRFSTSTWDANGSDIHGYIHNTRATSNNMGAMYIGDFLYNTTSTNISGTGTVYVSFGYQSASGSLHPAPVWNPNTNEDDRSWQSISNCIVQEIA